MADPKPETDKTPAAEASAAAPKAKAEAVKPASPETLILRAPVNGLVAGRVVTASAKTAERLISDKAAERATPEQIAIAGGRIPHLNA